MQRNNEGLQVMFDEVLQRNTKMLKDEEQQDATHQEMQANFETWKQFTKRCCASFKPLTKKNEGLRLMFNKARRRNKGMLKGATGSNTQRDCVQASRHQEKQ